MVRGHFTLRDRGGGGRKIRGREIRGEREIWGGGGERVVVRRSSGPWSLCPEGAGRERRGVGEREIGG